MTVTEHPAPTGATPDELDPDLLAPGQLIRLQLGSVAHGGHCVGRFGGRVIFVRLGLPGEDVVARVTEVKPRSFCRADVVAVLDPDPDRVPAPCQHFEPGGCGGCDWQHATPARQRSLKASVVVEQLQRLAGLSVEVEVEAIGADLGYRTRVRWALDQEGRIGPRRHRSHEAVAVSGRRPCLIAAEGFSEFAAVLDPPTAQLRRGRHRPEVELVRTPDGPIAVWPDQRVPDVVERAVDRGFTVAADGFWQVHPAAADTLAEAVGDLLPDLTGGSAWDLYGGAGLFAAVLAPAVGESGTVVSVEGDRPASALAKINLADLTSVTAIAAPVERFLENAADRVDVVVLDPPRSGAGVAVCQALADRRPRLIVYVACDPAALGRDTAALLAAGYRLDSLRAFDCFPQTHHVECVAAFVPRE